MRVFLDAYFDNNFGDDLFVDTLLKRYPQTMFYTFWKDVPSDVIARATQFENLVILPPNSLMQDCWQFDAYVMIGGDVLPNGVDYSRRISHMRNVKNAGGFVAMLGFSLYAEYGEQTKADLCTMAEIADVIVIRDKMSAKRFKELVPQASVIESTDMAFTKKYSDMDSDKRNVLGIIPRRKLYSTDEDYQNYCQRMAEIADYYLEQNEEAKICFFAFSTGTYDDRAVSADIVSRMRNDGCTEVVSYEGNIEAFLQRINSCKALLPTRFHGLVFALLFRIPFVPVPYEVKITQLLDELEYEGVRIPYEKDESGVMPQEVLKGLSNFAVSKEHLVVYERKADVFFEGLDAWYSNCNKCNENRDFLKKLDESLEGRSDIIEENKFLKSQQMELEKWISTLKDEREAFELQNLELEKVRKVQEEQINRIPVIENENRLLKEQVEELMRWIDSLKKERSAFERQNLELDSIRGWYKDKLMRRTLQPKKLEEEYNVFLKELQEKLNAQYSQ